jgi:hypothetical protein
MCELFGRNIRCHVERTARECGIYKYVNDARMVCVMIISRRIAEHAIA